MQTKKGFTLIELLVVVLIIGILSAIALPIYFNMTRATKLKTHISVLRPIIEAEKRYKLAVGQYQPDIDLLDISVPYESKTVATNKGTYTTEWGTFIVLSSGTNMDTLIRIQVTLPGFNGSINLFDPNDKESFEASIPGASNYSVICIAKDNEAEGICRAVGTQFYSNGTNTYFGF